MLYLSIPFCAVTRLHTLCCTITKLILEVLYNKMGAFKSCYKLHKTTNFIMIRTCFCNQLNKISN